ncbi:MFS transporter [Solimonas soli]|uniref:MFS transporter n=1 Tax=Solimonas soli TaxID=413479 RepID=UPI00048A15C2|nr:MFS transporter [Solimonas soli]
MTRARTLLLLSALYLSQGLPYGFFSQALPVLMREAGYSLVKIGASTLLFLPWSLKFLWAPYIDRYGTRKRWLFALQFGAAAVALGMATLELSDSLRFVFVALFLFNLLAATQDVATDGLAVVLLAPRDRGIGNAIQTGGYRLGMVIGGGLLLWVYTIAGWRFMFVAMALMLALLLLPVFSLREPLKAPAGPAPGALAVAATGWQRLRRPGIALLLVLLSFFKFGDSMGAALVGPFMKDSGLTLQQIALIKGTVASVCGLVGAVLGGWLAWRHGRRVALLFGGLTQTAALIGYALAALGLGGAFNFGLIVGACIAEHVLGGAATVALFTLMMDAAEPEHAGTDYTLLACTVILAQGSASIAAGLVAQHGGYALLFALSTVLSAAGCLTLVAAVDRRAGPARLQAVWRSPRPIAAGPGAPAA